MMTDVERVALAERLAVHAHWLESLIDELRAHYSPKAYTKLGARLVDVEQLAAALRTEAEWLKQGAD
jgi:hypothetical protein